MCVGGRIYKNINRARNLVSTPMKEKHGEIRKLNFFLLTCHSLLLGDGGAVSPRCKTDGTISFLRKGIGPDLLTASWNISGTVLVVPLTLSAPNPSLVNRIGFADVRSEVQKRSFFDLELALKAA